MTQFQVAAVVPAVAPVPAPVSAPAPFPATIVDDALVPDLRLPHVPGLPGPDSPGLPIGKLPAPPTKGSLADRADMSVVKGAQLLRTPAGDAWAVRMAKDGAYSIWMELARRQVGLTGAAQGWLNAALVAATLGANGATSAYLKHRFKRDRPYVTDPTIKPPVPLPSNSSYPSGHASSAFAAARVIAALQPALATEAYSLATQVAVSRVYAGVHYPTDVVAGALIGTGIGDAVLRTINKDGLDAVAA